MTIKEVSEKYQLSKDTLRYYEKKRINWETAEKVYKNYCKLYQQSFYFDILYIRNHGDVEC